MTLWRLMCAIGSSVEALNEGNDRELENERLIKCYSLVHTYVRLFYLECSPPEICS